MKRYLFFVTLFFATTANAQLQRLGSWDAINLKYNINKKWSVQAGEMVRWYTSPAYETQWLTEVEIKRELSKRFDVSGGYRFTYRTTEKSHRIYGDVAYNYRYKGFQISDRLRYQYEWDKFYEVQQYARNKLTLKYRKPKKFTPLIAGELFYRLGYSYYFVDQFRLFAGTDYKINKHFTLGAALVHTQEIQVTKPLSSEVLQLELTYEF